MFDKNIKNAEFCLNNHSFIYYYETLVPKMTTMITATYSITDI